MAASKLTPKQEAFVREYLVDLDATKAAIRAGYSERTAGQQGHQLLKKTSVAAAIQEAQQARAERTGLTQDDVIEGLVYEAKFYGEGASHSARVSAWAHLGKHIGMFKERIEHGGRVRVEVAYVDDPN